MPNNGPGLASEPAVALPSRPSPNERLISLAVQAKLSQPPGCASEGVGSARAPPTCSIARRQSLINEREKESDSARNKDSIAHPCRSALAKRKVTRKRTSADVEKRNQCGAFAKGRGVVIGRGFSWEEGGIFAFTASLPRSRIVGMGWFDRRCGVRACGEGWVEEIWSRVGRLRVYWRRSS